MNSMYESSVRFDRIPIHSRRQNSRVVGTNSVYVELATVDFETLLWAAVVNMISELPFFRLANPVYVLEGRHSLKDTQSTRQSTTEATICGVTVERRRQQTFIRCAEAQMARLGTEAHRISLNWPTNGFQ
jgi:hypothetical protein